MIELFDEIVELALLLKTIEARRACGFLFEREMHAFVSSILLGMTRPDPFDTDAQTKPPDRKAAEIEKRIPRGEGYAIIGTNRMGQTAFLEQTLKGRNSEAFSRRLQSFTEKQITRSVIGYGQRVAIFLIAQQKLAFVVGAPEFVGIVSQR